MRTRQLPGIGPALLVAALLATVAAAGEPPPQAPDVLADFQRAWKPLIGAQHLRPPEDAGWKARMQAFRKLGRTGDGAVRVLTDAAKKGDDEMRVFAARRWPCSPTPLLRML